MPTCQSSFARAAPALGASGTLRRTNVPRPTAAVTYPSSARRRYTRTAVRWLMPASAASARVAGSFEPGSSSPLSMRPAMWFVSCCVIDVSPSRTRSNTPRMCDIDIVLRHRTVAPTPRQWRPVCHTHSKDWLIASPSVRSLPRRSRSRRAGRVVVIRPARDEDRPMLRELAELDSAEPLRRCRARRARRRPAVGGARPRRRPRHRRPVPPERRGRRPAAPARAPAARRPRRAARSPSKGARRRAGVVARARVASGPLPHAASGSAARAACGPAARAASRPAARAASGAAARAASRPAARAASRPGGPRGLRAAAARGGVCQVERL